MFENREIVLALFYIMKETKVLLLLNYSDMLLPLESKGSFGGWRLDLLCGGINFKFVGCWWLVQLLIDRGI